MRTARLYDKIPIVRDLLARLAAYQHEVPTASLQVAGVAVPVFGVDVTTAPPFSARQRDQSGIIKIEVHESVTRSASATAKVLRRRKVGRSGRRNVLGVHAMAPADGGIIQHNDLADRCAHIEGANDITVGLEVVNPYYTTNLRPGLPWKRVIRDAPWADKKKYVVPTRAQLEAVVAFIRAVVGSELLSVPMAWPGVINGRFAMRKVDGVKRAPGIAAHHQSGNHADGAFPVLYAYLRIEQELSAHDAYETAIDLATGARGWVTL